MLKRFESEQQKAPPSKDGAFAFVLAFAFATNWSVRLAGQS